MESVKRIICCLLSALIVLGMAACGDTNPTEKPVSSKDEPSSSESSTVDTSSPNSTADSNTSQNDVVTEQTGTSGNTTQNQNGNGYYETNTPNATVSEILSGTSSFYREPYKSENTETKEKFVDTDGDFDYKTVKWDGPVGYVIVYPANDTKSYDNAVYLQNYYKQVHNITLNILADTAPAVEKEILLGNTNRSESKHSLKEGELQVSLKGKKLVFVGGHYVTNEAAVKRFTRLMPDKNEAFTFKLKTDFTTTLSSLPGYKFTWGDEFEDWYDLDYGRWNYRLGMAGNTQIETAYDREVIDISDGRLKLTPCYIFDPSNKDVQFKVPWSVATSETMNYVYGYCEIRARVPYFNGIWPSFWGGTGCNLSGTNSDKWHAEIDVFENFGTSHSIKPNIHKWYDSRELNDLLGVAADKRAHFQYPKRNTYTFTNTENLNNEYHIYGYEWTPTEMNIFVDGVKYMTFDITKSFDPNPDMSMFHEAQYSQFNCHLYTSTDEESSNLIYNSMDMLPAEYYIDYYRLYQKDDGQSKLFTNTSNRYKVYSNRTKEISLK